MNHQLSCKTKMLWESNVRWMPHLALWLLGFATPAFAINKCVEPDGRVTFQERPCPGHVIQARPAPTTAPPAPIEPPLPSPLTFPKKAESEFREALTSTLKDPTSVQFRDVRLVWDGRALCGSANAKNSYGGYVGFRAFVVDAEGVYWQNDGSDETSIGKYVSRRTFVPKAHFWQCLQR